METWNANEEWGTPFLCEPLSVFRCDQTKQVLMGDFDFYEMSQVSAVFAFFWFWTFQGLVFLIMLNMLLAIVLDTYSQVPHICGPKKMPCK